jgi:hypothetical protein
MVKIPLNNLPGASATVSASSSVVLEWKLPTQVYNLSKSYITYSLSTAAIAAKSIANFEDVFDLGSSITFGAAGGNNIVDLQYANNYIKVARKLDTNMEDYLKHDDLSQLYKSDALSSANVVPGGNNGVYTGTVNYLENNYLVSGAVNTAQTVYRRFPLGAFSGTLFGVDRNYYSPVEQYLRITAGTGYKMAYAYTTGADPSAGAQATGDITINNLYLYLCVEQNPLIQEEMLARYRSGKLAFRIPYTTGFKNVSGAAGTQANIQIQLSQQYGKRLKRILHSAFNGQEMLNTAYDTDNTGGLKITQFQTFMDNIPLQDRILLCTRPAAIDAAVSVLGMDDWLENKKYVENRSMIQSKEHYQLNWFHIDQFYEPHDKDSMLVLPEVNIDEGLPMDTPKQWLLSANVGQANLVHYTFAQFARDVMITEMGAVFV